MVYILDEGSVFDAPIDKIWKYLPSEGHRHNSLKLISREMVLRKERAEPELSLQRNPTRINPGITTHLKTKHGPRQLTGTLPPTIDDSPPRLGMSNIVYS